MGTLEDLIKTGQPLRTVAPDDAVLEAVDAMCRWHTRAVIVGSAVDPVGILCERDVLERVVRPQRDPATTKVSSVMTAPLVCLPASASPEDALTYMSEHRVHQVPVTGQEALIGIVSASDLRRWALARREHDLDILTSYVTMGR
jgi:CBS domain-containing protein